MNEAFVKTMVGTGAVINVFCGFVPAHVQVVNIQSATKEQLDWYRGMPDASAIKLISPAARSTIVANGITPLGDAATDTTEQGFAIGADADVNVAGETIVIIAHRGGVGNQF
jgi:hypothetical protein